VNLTDAEFERLLEKIITPDVFAAAKTLRTINDFTRDDGTPLNFTLVNIKDWCKNTFEVVNQLRINTGNSHQRYDVILLINGVPVAQIELKSLGISPRRALEQIVEYKNDPGNGYTNTLLCFMQLFIVSNRTDTWYFANNNNRHFSFNADEQFIPVYQFAAEDNAKITHLDSFAEKFLPKCTLGQTISRYMVLIASEQKLMVMRPYQIYAVKAIVQCIDENSGNGYIWHTTGSGKTLTSFKAATLLKDNDKIAKCLFVVDRKDLDRQTREEFNKFQEKCVEENTHTGALVRRLLSDDYADKVIVTTIQKLGLALDEDSKRNKENKQQGKATYKDQLAPLRDQRMVFIFDECHRSQFGENHQTIKKFFPNSQLFGFTGTPIFEQNAAQQQITGDIASLRTTQDLFQQELHAYTITHAIEDRNVLRFHVDYYKPEDENVLRDAPILGKKAVIEAILSKHDAATGGRKFNALLATASINDAIEYFNLFQAVQAELQKPDAAFQPLNVGCVFSPPADGNKDVLQIQEDLPQEKADNQQDPEGKKAALKNIIADYNQRFGTNHSIGEFDLYYQDVQQRIKEQQKKGDDGTDSKVRELDFEFVLFASAVIDYDYIMALIARYSAQPPGKQKLTREQLIGLIQADAKFLDERDDIRDYINTLKVGEGLSEKAIRDGYQQFKAEKNAQELAAVARKNELELAALQGFVDDILQRMIFDGEQLTDLMEPLGLNWKNRRVKELALREDLVPLLNKRAQGREISGLSAYDQ
jgi:type I restriction enzyme R subunit